MREYKYKDFAARLAYAMALKGLKSKDIIDGYKQLGQTIHPSTVSQILAGKFPPVGERVEILSEILGVDIVWLQGYGSVDDIHKRLTVDEQRKALRRIRKIFMSLRPELQYQVIDFVNHMETVRQEENFKYQQKMSQTKGSGNDWKLITQAAVLVSDNKK